MTPSTLIDSLVGLAFVAWICARQLRRRPAGLFKLPVILGIAGVASMALSRCARSMLVTSSCWVSRPWRR
ncbi:hypothetical protein [Actinoplanes sp. N902-109]|uniref:hypothetical protein n=1 Tax=Actinoplanes sp. (strain N902-109) TaxID=649831 RepID=UPI00039CD804|nr:hypothetical protein [Actinoplanes sp. N902-109]